MKHRTRALLPAIVVSLGLSGIIATPAWADPPPWAASYHKHRGRSCNHPSHDRSYDRYRYGSSGVDARCGHIIDRAEKARRGLARWERTGQHRDAVRAWREVLARTPQRLAECRQAARYDGRAYPGAYDRLDDYRYGDPYEFDDPYGRSFDWKRDWPFLLGGLLGQYGNGN